MNKIQVSERAVVARVRRTLKKSGSQLRACREMSRWHSDLGDWYIVDTNNSTVSAQHCDLENLARELGALKAHEVMERDMVEK